MPASVSMVIKTRIAVLWQIIRSTPALVLFWPFAGIGAYDTLLSQVLPEELAQTLPRLRDVFPVTREWIGQTWLLILAAALIVVIFEYAHRLYVKMQPRLVIVYEPELTAPPILVMRHIGIEVRNTGAAILQHCTVALENLTHDRGHNYKLKRADLRTGMTFCAGEAQSIEVARCFEGQAQREIAIQYESGEFQSKVPSDDTYYFDLVTYSNSPPDRKHFKLYVDDGGRLRMEESPRSRT